MQETLKKTNYSKSTFLWIVVLVLSANFMWGYIKPLQAVPHTSQPNLELSIAALRFKMEELKAGKEPDILIIGSSLPMCAFFYTERPPFFDLKEGAKINQLKLNLLQAYPEAGYFTEKLKEICGQKLDVFNFAGAACMVSDTKLVVERTLAAEKKPKVIIYGVGLRDFVDNVNPPPGETPYYKALCNLPFLINHVAQVSHFSAFNDLMMCALCKLYDLRNEFRITAEHAACETFHHPSTLQIAFQLGDLNRQIKADQQKKLDQNSSPGAPAASRLSTSTSKVIANEGIPMPAGSRRSQGSDAASTSVLLAAASPAIGTPITSVAAKIPAASSAVTIPAASSATAAIPAVINLAATNKDNKPTPPSTQAAVPSILNPLDYPQRYAPANYARLKAEMSELQNLIASCKQKGIKLVLINMPVSQGHIKLSPPGLRDRYLQDLRAIAPKADLFLDYESAALPDSYFFDTVHLNGTGSVKFVDDLTNRLQSSRLLVPQNYQTAFAAESL